MTRVVAACALSLSLFSAHAGTATGGIQKEMLLQTTTAWDGSAYQRYPDGQPQLTTLKIVIPAHTTMDWHSHPVPNMAYVVAGEITVEKKDGGATERFVKGQVIAETVDALHRGVTGEQAVELVVFYAGTARRPLSEAAVKSW